MQEDQSQFQTQSQTHEIVIHQDKATIVNWFMCYFLYLIATSIVGTILASYYFLKLCSYYFSHMNFVASCNGLCTHVTCMCIGSRKGGAMKLQPHLILRVLRL